MAESSSSNQVSAGRGLSVLTREGWNQAMQIHGYALNKLLKHRAAVGQKGYEYVDPDDGAETRLYHTLLIDGIKAFSNFHYDREGNPSRADVNGIPLITDIGKRRSQVATSLLMATLAFQDIYVNGLSSVDPLPSAPTDGTPRDLSKLSSYQMLCLLAGGADAESLRRDYLQAVNYIRKRSAEFLPTCTPFKRGEPLVEKGAGRLFMDQTIFAELPNLLTRSLALPSKRLKSGITHLRLESHHTWILGKMEEIHRGILSDPNNNFNDPDSSIKRLPGL